MQKGFLINDGDPMNPLDQIAEARIQKALEAGELSHLPGEGKPVSIADDYAVPEALRVAYRVLKNAGFLPPELQLYNDIKSVEHLLNQISDTAERSRAQVRLQMLKTHFETIRRRPLSLSPGETYHDRILEQMQKR